MSESDEVWPAVSVVMPVRNEERSLAASVEAVLAQDYPGPYEVVIAHGPSVDDTAGVVARLAAADARVRAVENPSGLTPAGLNRALAASSGELVVRVDGHAVIPPGYVRRAVSTLRATGADNVGGVQEAVGTTPFEQAVAAAMSSAFGVGDARFHYGGRPGPADTVYLGAFRREALERVGGYDEGLPRAQDADLNHRIRASGGVVWFDPELRVRYQPRGDLRALARQYRTSGGWRRRVVQKDPASLRWRQLVPPVALVGVGLGVLLGLSGRRTGWLAPAVYGGSVAAATAVSGRNLGAAARLRLPAVFVTMHGSWGLGFLLGPRHAGRTTGITRSCGSQQHPSGDEGERWTSFSSD